MGLLGTSGLSVWKRYEPAADATADKAAAYRVYEVGSDVDRGILSQDILAITPGKQEIEAEKFSKLGGDTVLVQFGPNFYVMSRDRAGELYDDIEDADWNVLKKETILLGKNRLSPVTRIAAPPASADAEAIAAAMTGGAGSLGAAAAAAAVEGSVTGEKGAEAGSGQRIVMNYHVTTDVAAAFKEMDVAIKALVAGNDKLAKVFGDMYVAVSVMGQNPVAMAQHGMPAHVMSEMRAIRSNLVEEYFALVVEYKESEADMSQRAQQGLEAAANKQLEFMKAMREIDAFQTRLEGEEARKTIVAEYKAAADKENMITQREQAAQQAERALLERKAEIEATVRADEAADMERAQAELKEALKEYQENMALLGSHMRFYKKEGYKLNVSGCSEPDIAFAPNGRPYVVAGKVEMRIEFMNKKDRAFDCVIGGLKMLKPAVKAIVEQSVGLIEQGGDVLKQKLKEHGATFVAAGGIV